MSDHNTKGHSVLELTIVTVVVVIVSTLAFGKFVYVIERAKTMEAVDVLRQVKAAQGLYEEFNGNYAQDFSGLHFQVPMLENFERIEVYDDPLNLCEIYHKDLSYYLSIDNYGIITCRADPDSDNICEKLGF